MALDAIIVSDSGKSSFSGVSAFRLEIEGQTARIQVVANYIKNGGKLIWPIEGDGIKSWDSSPKLNGIYLHNYLSKNKFEIGLIQSYFDQKDTFSVLLKESPHSVIISTSFICSKSDLYRLINDIRSQAPDIKIIVGGPFIYHSYQLFQKLSDRNYDVYSAKGEYLFIEIANEPPVDLYIVSLHGEKILCEVLKHIKQGKAITDLPNTAYFDGHDYRFNKRIDEFTLANEQIIDWDLVPDTIFKNGVVPLQASNGCPYNCAFCNFIKDRRLNFSKSNEQIIDEMKTVATRGAEYIRFTDDNFRLGGSDLNLFCQGLIEENIPVRWMSFIRASTLAETDIDLLRRSGCIEVQIGLESAHPNILNNMNKKSDPQRYKGVLERLLTAGINCPCSFIFGFPGETKQTAQYTRKFIESIDKPNYEGILTWSIFPFILAPLSPIYEKVNREKYGLSGYLLDWKHNTMNSKQASEEIKKTFLEVETSSPMYLGDNLDMLHELPPGKRKKFVLIRHQLSKLSLKGPLQPEQIINAFGEIFPSTK